MAHGVPRQFIVTEIEPGHLTALFPCEAPGCTEKIKGEISKLAVFYAKGIVSRNYFEKLAARGIGGFLRVFEFPVDHRYLDDFRRLRQDSPRFTHLISSDVYPFAEQAFRLGDPVALDYYADLPFMCNTCKGIYCVTHFQLEGVPEDEFDDRILLRKVDYWRGVCPKGHPHLVE